MPVGSGAVRPEAEFGLWRVVSYSGDKKWKCKCRCGTERPVLTSALNSGRSQSCGCADGKQRRTVRPDFAKHGMSGTPTWISWVGMIQRCTDPNLPSYKDYGAKGVTVCERWLDFANFYADMGERPPGLTLERRDRAKGYDPDNCEWATRTTQAENRSITHWIEIGGRRHTLTEWARMQGILQPTVSMRLKRGWTEEQALGFAAPPTR